MVRIKSISLQSRVIVGHTGLFNLCKASGLEKKNSNSNLLKLVKKVYLVTHSAHAERLINTYMKSFLFLLTTLYFSLLLKFSLCHILCNSFSSLHPRLTQKIMIPFFVLNKSPNQHLCSPLTYKGIYDSENIS